MSLLASAANAFHRMRKIRGLDPKLRGRCLGYFFGPLQLSPPSLRDCAGLTAKEAKFIRRFSDYHIRLGYWAKLGMLSGRNANAGVCQQLRNLPKDGFAGSRAVEITLTKALDAAGYEAMRG
jgi:hypothetical protein